MRILVIMCLLSLGCSKKEAAKKDPPQPVAKGKKRSMAHAKRVTVVPPGDHEGTAKDLTKQFSENKLVALRKAFAPSLAKRYPLVKLTDAHKRVLSVTGPFRGVQSVKRIRRGSFQVYVVKALFEHMLWDFIYTFDTRGRITDFFNRPGIIPWKKPPYAPATPATTIAVSLGKAPWTLEGILTIPAGKGPFPAIILVHDRGPKDMDSSTFSNKPFKDLAMGLAARGVAVLRYNKRTHAHRARALKERGLTLMEETVDDAVGAFTFLHTVPAIAPKKIFLLGHGLGGYAMSLISQKTKGAAGFILMAPLGVHPAKSLANELTYLSTLPGEERERILGRLKHETRRADLVTSGDLTATTPQVDLPQGRGFTEYWIFLRKYDHLAALKAVVKPILMLWCDKDYQVTLTT
ncbi:alpha/beta fold hydrolase, partial [Myxococcota bacterium]|nr:alpha/beta fold hydrolase [Myxococcota bacterium]